MQGFTRASLRTGVTVAGCEPTVCELVNCLYDRLGAGMPHKTPACRAGTDGVHITPWTKTWRNLELRVEEPCRLTSTVGPYTAGSFATVTNWERTPWHQIKAVVLEHLRPQLLRVGDPHVYKPEVGAYQFVSHQFIFDQAYVLVQKALEPHRHWAPNLPDDVRQYNIPIVKIFTGGKIRRGKSLPPLPEITVEAQPEPGRGSRIVHMLVQVWPYEIALWLSLIHI